MEHKYFSCRLAPPSSFHCLLLPCLLVVLLSCHGTMAYKNYTVGDSLGWFDNLMQPKVDYQKWAAGKNFSLGDFLFFNTDKNHSVVQTYNVTTYRQCDYEDAEEDDTTQWSAAAPEYSADPVTVAVPLLKVGPTYFFSGNYDGEQCQHGQHFMINVTYGRGLPESLKSPSEAAPGPANPDDGADASSVPANFDHPKDVGNGESDAKPTSGAGKRVARLLREQGAWRIHVGLALLWLLVFKG
ncbi:blue copper protein-like [Canna indica]|uniref:Blue copper protein-like n=1 Tax=Canna indica TaxID=4628 RepID=A0AAQ3Q7M9_9LILI|nr:blue copper protein-like [Canna indica]